MINWQKATDFAELISYGRSYDILAKTSEDRRCRRNIYGRKAFFGSWNSGYGDNPEHFMKYRLEFDYFKNMKFCYKSTTNFNNDYGGNMISYYSEDNPNTNMCYWINNKDYWFIVCDEKKYLLVSCINNKILIISETVILAETLEIYIENTEKIILIDKNFFPSYYPTIVINKIDNYIKEMMIGQIFNIISCEISQGYNQLASYMRIIS